MRIDADFTLGKPQLHIHVIGPYGYAPASARLLDRHAASQDSGVKVRELFGKLAHADAQRRRRREVAKGDLGREHAKACCDTPALAI